MVGRLALAGFDFVAAEIFLGFGVSSVFTCDWIVLFKDDFFGRILRILRCIVRAVTTKITD